MVGFLRGCIRQRPAGFRDLFRFLIRLQGLLDKVSACVYKHPIRVLWVAV